MSSVYTPTPVALGNITIPSDGDTIEAGDVNVPVEAVADGVKFVMAGTTTPLADLTALAAILAPTDGLVKHVVAYGLYVFKTSATAGLSPFRIAAGDATAGGWVASHAHETTRTTLVACADLPAPRILGTAVAPVDPVTAGAYSYVTPSTGSTDLAVSSTGGFVGLQWNTAVSVGSAIAKALLFSGINRYLINGGTLSTVTMRLQGLVGHAALPLLMPKMGIVRVTADGVQTNLLSTGLVTDASASTAAYQATHSLVLTPDQNNVIDTTTYAYAVYLWNEGNTNAIAGLIPYSLSFAHTAIPDARRS